MARKIIIYPVAMVLALLFGCDTPIPGEGSNGIQINSAHGTTEYRYLVYNYLCSNSGSNDSNIKASFSGSTLVQSYYQYSSTDGSCSSGETLKYSIKFELSDEGDLLTSWAGGIVPSRFDGYGYLDSSPTATKFKATILSITPGTSMPSGSVGDVYKTLLYVDDTSFLFIKYIGTTIGGSTSDGYPLLLNPIPASLDWLTPA